MVASRSKTRVKAREAGFRSGLEQRVAEALEREGVPVVYETDRLKYQVSEVREYTPDFKLPNGIYIETKGRFTTADRKKHLLVRLSHPSVDIRFVFSDASGKIRKGSKTTYADWCRKHGFLFSDKGIPAEWLKEPPK